jgi:hypothetical protein
VHTCQGCSCRHPDYINPFVLVLLAKRNQFRRQGSYAAADKLACAFNIITANNIGSRMCKLANAPVKETWSTLKLNSAAHDRNN